MGALGGGGGGGRGGGGGEDGGGGGGRAGGGGCDSTGGGGIESCGFLSCKGLIESVSNGRRPGRSSEAVFDDDEYSLELPCGTSVSATCGVGPSVPVGGENSAGAGICCCSGCTSAGSFVV